MVNRRVLIQSLAVASVSAGVSYLAAKGVSPFFQGSYVQLGTSITGGVSPKAAITPRIVGERLGLLGINAGFDGACAGHHKFPGLEQRALYSIVDAITSGDWTPQNTETHPPLKLRFSQLMKVDFSDAHVGLEYGTNDFNYDRPMGLNSDATPETFKGALNYSIKKLIATFPRLRLFLMTPTWRLNFAEKDSDKYPNETGHFLKEYVDGMLEIAGQNHIPCLEPD